MKNYLFLITLLMISVPFTAKTIDVNPDLSDLSDGELHKRIKKSAAEFAIGVSFQYLSKYTPTLSVRNHQDTELFSEKVINGMGAAMIIDGSKEFFFCSNEVYKRFRKDSPLLTKGLMDLSLATTIYMSAGYVPFFLGDTLSQFGGESALTVLYSIVALRGVKDTSLALIEQAGELSAIELTNGLRSFYHKFKNKIKRN